MISYILITGSRVLDRAETQCRAEARDKLQHAMEFSPDGIVVVHGDAQGWDTIFDLEAKALGMEVEPWSARLFNHPFARNEFIVNLVAGQKRLGHRTACWTFASKWASGTGNCARKARDAGLKVTDYRASTV